MKRMQSARRARIGLLALLICSMHAANCLAADIAWPAITSQNKPWTRWWWLGNIGTDQQLSVEMEKYSKVNLGGLELTPIYGVRGQEDKFVQYLTPQWTARLEHILKEGKRLDLGIDMATGNGWPFGGPWVTPQDSARTILYKTYTVKAGEKLADPVAMTQEPYYRAIDFTGDMATLKDPYVSNPNLQQMGMEVITYARKLPLHVLMAYSDTGQSIDLTNKVGADGRLDWTAPAGNWTLYALFLAWHGKLVERAGPGGEGDVIDHMTRSALMAHLGQFEKAFAGKDIKLRAWFNDSYEVDDGPRTQHNWTPKLFDEFQKRRGYDLRPHIAKLLGADRSEDAARVISDYRETVSDLLVEEYTQVWAKWAEDRGTIIRNQAHGSPGNVFDLYAASHIPETEGGNTLRSKFTASAAHVAGHQLTSSESATWQGGHFMASLADMKPIMDRFMLGGVNHIFYHGTPFSPAEEPWPGILFYAGAEFTPTNSWWDDFAAFNAYIARCQSFLQGGKPDEGVLLYYSVHDYWGGLVTAGGRGGGRGGRGVRGGAATAPAGARRGGGAGGEAVAATAGQGRTLPLVGSSEAQAGAVGQTLYAAGHSFDYVSDRYLAKATASNGQLSVGGNAYRAIVVPQSQLIPLESLDKLVKLAQSGATIIVQNRLPSDVPGLGNLEPRRQQLKALLDQIKFAAADQAGIQVATVGSGRFLMGENLDAMLSRAGVKRETMVEQGLAYIRRVYDDGRAYFVVNQGETAIDGWVPIQQVGARTVAIFDPMTGKSGLAATRGAADGSTEVYVQLLPGDSTIIRTYTSAMTGPAFAYWSPGRIPGTDAQPLAGSWAVRFVKGGPTLPQEMQITELKSWTEFGTEAYKNFSGTATYTLTFPRPAGRVDAWRLNLGSVLDSARVTLNGREIATVFKAPYQVTITPDMLADNNTLVVAVSNQMINRIAEMDRHNQEFRRFYNANVQRMPSQATTPPRPSGLVGPVQLVPLSKLDPVK